MGWLDVAIGVVTIIWAATRAWRGFAKVAIQLAGSAAGLWAALRFSASVTQLIADTWGVPLLVGRPLSFLLLLFVPTVAGHTIGELVPRPHPASRWRRINRIGGALLGTFEVALMCAIALVAWARAGGSLHAPFLANSAIAGLFMRVIPPFYDWVAEVFIG